MLVTFLNHQWTAFWRSRGKAGTIATQIIMGFFILYAIGVALMVGLSAESLIDEFLPGRDTMEVFNGVILYYFAIDFLVRMQLQELPTISIVPYLHLNIPRHKLVSFLNIRALFSAFNIIPLLLFYPFCMTNISIIYSFYATVMYLLAIFSLTIFNNYAALYFKRISMGNIRFLIAGMLLLTLAGLLEYFKIFSITSISNTVFQAIALRPATGIIFIIIAAVMFFTNSRFLKNNLYVEELKTGEKKKSSTDYPFLDRFGDAGTLVALEIKLILRNKRTRSTVLKGLIFLFYGFIIYKEKALAENRFALMLMIAMLMTGNIIVIYGQFMFGCQAAEFDGLLSNKVNIRTFFKAKFLLFTLTSTLFTAVTCLYGFISWKVIILQFALYFYNIGIGSLIILYFATYNDKAIDISKSASFNWQGVNASSMLMAIPLLLLPYAIYLGLSLFLHPYWCIAGIAIAGIAGILSRSFWLDFLVSEFNKRKYKIAAGFREKS